MATRAAWSLRGARAMTVGRRSQERSLHHEEEEKGPPGGPPALQKSVGGEGEREKQPSGLAGICGCRGYPLALVVW